MQINGFLSVALHLDAFVRLGYGFVVVVARRCQCLWLGNPFATHTSVDVLAKSTNHVTLMSQIASLSPTSEDIGGANESYGDTMGCGGVASPTVDNTTPPLKVN